MIKCKNCNEPQETEDGIVTFYDDLCEACHEHQEFIAVLNEDFKVYG